MLCFIVCILSDAWANREDPDEMWRLIRVYTVCHSPSYLDTTVGSELDDQILGKVW